MIYQGGDEEKFKLVVEANAVLSDPDRRARYDMGEDEDGLNEGFSGGMGGMHAMNVDLSEIFAQFHGAGAFGGAGAGGAGGAGFSSYGGRSFGGQTFSSGNFSSAGSGFGGAGRSRGFSQGFPS